MRQKTEKMKLSEQGVISEEALLAYVNNELSAEEKQELEKLLKEDPFAQEALEGLQQSNKTNAAAAVININKKVRERTGLKEGRTIKLHWSNYAWAAVVFGLLIGVGFIMVAYLGKQDSSIAMNKKIEETVNLMEKKVDEPNLVPVTSAAVTDTPAINEQQKVATGESALKPTLTLETKKPDNKKFVEAENKDMKAVTATKQQTVTATGGAAAPPATVNITDNIGVATGKVSGNTNADQKAKERDEVAGKAEGKGGAKEETAKKNLQQRVADNAPATETELRGSIAEKVPSNKVTVITMDDAMKNFNSGDYKTSAEQFSEILKQQPNNTDALYFGGISDYINGNTKKSEKNFDKLLKEGTKFTEGSKWYKANILLKKGKKEEAKKILDDLSNTGGSYKERAIKKKAEMEF